MEKKKLNLDSKAQLNLFPSEQEVTDSTQSSNDSKNSICCSDVPSSTSAKVVHFTSPHLSEIYERILNRTMS